MKRLKELERENDRLRKAMSELTREKLILKEAASAAKLGPAGHRDHPNCPRKKALARALTFGAALQRWQTLVRAG